MLMSFSKKGTRRNTEVVLLNQQTHRFCIMIKSHYLTVVKAVHNEYQHTVKTTGYQVVPRRREAHPYLAKM